MKCFADKFPTDHTTYSSEQTFRNIFENSADAIVVSRDGVICESNPALRAMYGFKDQQSILGKSITALVAPQSRYLVANYNKNRFQDPTLPTFYECEGLRPDGTTFNLEVKATVYWQDDQVYTVAVLRDITLKKRVAETLQRSRNFHLSLFDEAPAYKLVCSPDGKPVYMNKALQHFVGTTPSRLVSGKGRKILHPDDFRDFLQKFVSAFSHQETFEGEYRCLRKDGAYRRLMILGKPFYDSTGKFDGYILNAFDISDRRRKLSHHEVRIEH